LIDVCSFFLFVFFFQAEDGIRDLTVTGVQTCALPISTAQVLLRNTGNLAVSGNNTWAVVLAGGDGTRLAALTTDRQGRVVPKQYCSLNGGMTLLQQAFERARRVVPPERICVIVADQHRDFWDAALAILHADNLIVQPRNCG